MVGSSSGWYALVLVRVGLCIGGLRGVDRFAVQSEQSLDQDDCLRVCECVQNQSRRWIVPSSRPWSVSRYMYLVEPRRRYSFRLVGALEKEIGTIVCSHTHFPPPRSPPRLIRNCGGHDVFGVEDWIDPRRPSWSSSSLVAAAPSHNPRKPVKESVITC